MKNICNYNQRELFGMLSNIGKINLHDWNLVCDLVNEMTNIKIIKKQWEGWSHYKNNCEYYPLDLSKINVWQESPKNIDLNFSVINNKLFCNVIVWKADNFDGRKLDKKFSAELELPNKFIKKLNDKIHYRFDSLLEDQYELFLETKKSEWMNNLKKEFIDHFNKKK